MKIEVENRQDAVALVLDGSLDIYTSLDLKTKIEECVDPKKQWLFINLSNVDYVDSSGIGTLIKGLNITSDNKVQFGIVGVQSSIEKVFKVAGLMSFFKIKTMQEYENDHPIIENK